MLKKLLSFIAVISLFLTGTAYAAVTPTPTTAPSVQQEQQNLSNAIDQLKEKIASRVAQLNLVDKRGIIGTVTDASNNQITLTDINGNIRFVDVDELTKFTSPTAKANFGFSDITKGATLGVYGLYNKESKRLLARFVNVMVLPTYNSGEISAIDHANYTLTVVGEDNKQTLVDIEDFTRTTDYDKTGNPTRSGYSKLQVGDRIIVVGYPNKTQKNRVTATRILVFPNLPKDPKITLPEPAMSASNKVTPSTGSGKTLTPITK